jgi:polyketide biosynthesis enoyl-CoA hydratase PksH
MASLSQLAAYETLRVRFDEDVCFLQLHRPEANNTINERLVDECRQVLEACREHAKIVVLEGLPEVFCFGADFQSDLRGKEQQDPEVIYDVWLQLASGPYVTIAHVKGKANAGGIGFVAACDLVLSADDAVYSLSELLFGLIPACVLPFLIRRVGISRANHMALMTQPISAEQAQAWGLVDAREANSDNLLRKHLLRLRRLSKRTIDRYKTHMNGVDHTLTALKPQALATNKAVFSDPTNLDNIERYVKTGQFPWE